MAKDRVTWEHRDVDTSARQTEGVTDYITPAFMIASTAGGLVNEVNNLSNYDTWHFGWYPYNPAKSLYDRMRIIYHGDRNAGALTLPEYTINAGVAWVPTVLAGAPPYAVAPPLSILDVITFGTEDVVLPLGAATWLGWRINTVGAAPTSLTWTITVFLYNSADTPF